MNQRDTNNYYEILEVAHDAPQSEIHRAYHRAKSTYSQDNPALYGMFTRDEALELMAMIEEAYAVIGNQALRKSYDETLLKDGQPFDVKSFSPEPTQSIAAAPTEQLARHTQAVQHLDSPPAGATGSISKRPQIANKSALAPGMGRTALSTFPLDAAIEAEIAETTEFDGLFLQKIRNYKNVSLDRLSEASRISRPYLSAVETNDYNTLPAAVFVRGFVVQIARHLGLDENKVAASYMKRFKAGGGK
jgi:curved DNA-binding protein CbpA